jgi:hypothetical protein
MPARRERTVGDVLVADLAKLRPLDDDLRTAVLASLERLGLANVPAPRRGNAKHYRWQRVCSGCGNSIGHSLYCNVLSRRERTHS